MGNIRKKLRLYYEFGQQVCPSCGNWFPPDGMTVDHIIPKSRGGTLAYTNIQLMCQPCNVAKGDKMPEELRN